MSSARDAQVLAVGCQIWDKKRSVASFPAGFMPTLFRLFIVLAFLAGLVFAGMFALTILVEPREREVTTRIPTQQLLSESNS